MRVVKKLNNNVAVCTDDHGRELIAFGKGIGFPAIPYELDDMGGIECTFYNISSRYMQMFDSLPPEVVEFTAGIVDLGRALLPYELSPNLLLTLSDHISFAIERARKGIFVKMPLSYDLWQMYPREVELGRRTLEAVRERFRVPLHPDEASGIAMAFINARVYHGGEEDIRSQRDEEATLEDITAIIQASMGLVLDRDSFNYARYATHVRYLLDRLRNGTGIDSMNADIYAGLREEYGQTAACVDQITGYLEEKHGFHMTDEEQLYLMLHINRVCANEEL